jgi:hypothetical protein
MENAINTVVDSEVDLSADMVNVRDIIARVEELRELIGEQKDIIADPDTDAEDMQEAKDALAGLDDEVAELAYLEGILSELCGCGGDEQWEGDWYPCGLILDSYFNEYMDQMLEDCGDIPKNIPAYLKITTDYDLLQTDYSSIDIGENTYWYR